jgi:hypothetical protein
VPTFSSRWGPPSSRSSNSRGVAVMYRRSAARWRINGLGHDHRSDSQWSVTISQLRGVNRPRTSSNSSKRTGTESSAGTTVASATELLKGTNSLIHHLPDQETQADHTELDVMVLDETGKPARPG